MLQVKMFTDTFYGSGLVGTVHNLVLSLHIDNILATTLLYQFLKILTTMETIDSTGWITQSVDDVCLESVGIVNYWFYTIFCLQAFGIEFGLGFAHYGIHRCFLSLNYSQRHTVGIKQHIVGITYA